MGESKDINELLSMEKGTEEVCVIPEPVATGSSEIEILSHRLLNKENSEQEIGKGVNVVLRNISGSIYLS
jgi:hypothetical protein